MCGRYTLKTNPAEIKRQLALDDVGPLEPRFNIAPQQAAPIITNTSPRALTTARWGLLPFWAKDPRLANQLLNARAETLADKAAFRDSLATHRCLVPCDGFYEWRRDGTQRTPFWVHRPDDHLLTMAGLWSTWTSPDGLDVTTFTIITTSANQTMQQLHTRMPVFIDPDQRAHWLHEPDLTLLTPWAGALELRQVSPLVNQAQAEGPACIEPAKVVQLGLFG